MNKLAVVAIVLVLACCTPDTAASSYDGDLYSSLYEVSEPFGVMVHFGRNRTTCSISWSHTAKYAESSKTKQFPKKDWNAAIASAFYSEVEFGYENNVKKLRSRRDFASLWTENRCGTTRLSCSVYIQDCNPTKSLYYRVRALEIGEDSINPVQDWSPIFEAKLPETGSQQTSRGEDDKQVYAIIGDMKVFKDQKRKGDSDKGVDSVPELTELAKKDKIKAVFHLGDIAYDIDDECASRGDEYLAAVESFSSRIPYVMVLGDHEQGRQPDANVDAMNGEDWEGATARLGAINGLGQALMARTSSPTLHYFSYNVHFIALNDQVYHRTSLYWMIPLQHRWLEDDLRSVDRRKTPWVVVMGHRSPWCVRGAESECNTESKMLRDGIPRDAYENLLHFDQVDNGNSTARLYGIGTLVDKYKVDLYLSGHTHHFERSKGMRGDKAVHSGSGVQGQATVYVVNGRSADNGQDAFEWGMPYFSQVRDDNYRVSYGLLSVTNAKLVYEQIDTVKGTVMDTFTISRSVDGGILPDDPEGETIMYQLLFGFANYIGGFLSALVVVVLTRCCCRRANRRRNSHSSVYSTGHHPYYRVD